MLLFKLIFIPCLIGVASLAGRYLGMVIGGWLIALPIIAGPLIFFLAVEQGVTFAAEAAQNTLTGVVSLCGFCWGYSWVSLNTKWPLALLSGWLLFFLSTAILNQLKVPLFISFALAIGVLTTTLWLFPQPLPPTSPVTLPKFEIILRMLAATLLIAVLTLVAQSLGPRLSGLLTPFPIIATVLAAFTHHSWGAPAAVQLLRGLVTGLFTFAVFFLVVAAMLEGYGIVLTFGLASVIALVLHGCSLWVVKKYLSITTGANA